MPMIAEMVDDETLGRLLPGAQDALLKVIAESQETNRPIDSWGVPIPKLTDAREVSEAMVRYAYTKMVSESQVQIGHYRYRWEGHLTALMLEMSGGVLTRPQAARLGQHIGWQLRGNGLGRNEGRRTWELTKLTDDRRLAMFNQTSKTIPARRDRKLEEQIYVQTKRNPPKPVSTSFDLSLIPPPDPTPEGVVEYVEKLTAGYAKLAERFAATCTTLATVTAERDELIKAAEDIVANEWNLASTRIAALVAKAGGDEK